jgi:hypothetical protein
MVRGWLEAPIAYARFPLFGERIGVRAANLGISGSGQAEIAPQVQTSVSNNNRQDCYEYSRYLKPSFLIPSVLRTSHRIPLHCEMIHGIQTPVCCRALHRLSFEYLSLLILGCTHEPPLHLR